MYCSNCGAQVAPNSAFCSTCGKPLQAQPPQPAGVIPQQAPGLLPQQPTGALPPPPMPYQPQPAPQGGSGWKTCLIVAGSLFVLLMLCGGIGVYMVGRTAQSAMTTFTESGVFPTLVTLSATGMPALETLAAISADLEEAEASLDEAQLTAEPAAEFTAGPAARDTPEPPPHVPPIEGVDGVPPQEVQQYFVAMTEPMTDYGLALGRLGQQTAEVSVDQGLLADSGWKNDTTTVLDELRDAGERLGDLGTPPAELQGFNDLLKQIASETPLMVDEYTKGMDQADFATIMASQQRLTKIAGLFGELQAELQQFQVPR